MSTAPATPEIDTLTTRCNWCAKPFVFHSAFTTHWHAFLCGMASLPTTYEYKPLLILHIPNTDGVNGSMVIHPGKAVTIPFPATTKEPGPAQIVGAAMDVGGGL